MAEQAADSGAQRDMNFRAKTEISFQIFMGLRSYRLGALQHRKAKLFATKCRPHHLSRFWQTAAGGSHTSDIDKGVLKIASGLVPSVLCRGGRSAAQVGGLAPLLAIALQSIEPCPQRRSDV